MGWLTSDDHNDGTSTLKVGEIAATRWSIFPSSQTTMQRTKTHIGTWFLERKTQANSTICTVETKNKQLDKCVLDKYLSVDISKKYISTIQTLSPWFIACHIPYQHVHQSIVSSSPVAPSPSQRNCDHLRPFRCFGGGRLFRYLHGGSLPLKLELWRGDAAFLSANIPGW